VDYAFAPGPTPFDQLMARLLDDRPTTDLMPASLGTVERFVDELETLSSVVKPVDSMFVASHANDSGQLKIQIDSTQKDVFADFETLEKAVTSGSIKIPPVLRTLPDGSPHPGTRVRIRGCRVGRAALFMEKLKEALGGEVTVTAPRHFHVVYPDTYPNGFEGMFEWLDYDFAIHSKTKLTRAQIIAALKAKQFDFYDGTKVPDAKWGGWVPKDPSKTKRRIPMTLILGTTVGPKSSTEIFVKDAREWRHNVPKLYTARITGLPAEPPTKAAKLAKVREALETLDMMGPLHEFPFWERYGYVDFDDFFNGVTWSVNWDKKAKRLTGTARRHEYHALLPITTRTATDPDRGDLIFNYFPHGGTGPEVSSLRDDDAFLFYTA
jgi:hypothetical protein